MRSSCFSQVTGNQWNNDRSDRPRGPDRSERWPIFITNEDQFKYEDNIKYEDDLKYEDNLK